MRMPMTASEYAPPISTKLHRPQVTANLVVRPRLVEMLNRGLSVPLTLVCAPAGFGKTTLVSAWIRDTGAANDARGGSLATAWLSLDEGDSDLNVFLRSFIAAIHAPLPGACAATLALLSAPERHPPELLHATLSNELALAPRPFLVVLDDYHLIGGSAVHDLLSALFRHWPSPLHLVLISRSNPPLPLPRLRASDQIVEIRSRDLRFTSEETACFMEKALGPYVFRPSPAAFALLEERTEGWAAALQLTALSMAAADDTDVAPALQAGPSLALLAGPSLALPAGVDAGIADYLVDEVLSRQPDDIQEFLLLTSILDRFCAELCAAVVAVRGFKCDVRSCLDRLVQANLFVTALDSTRTWYRYHHLFRDFHRHRVLAAIGQKQVADLHRAAAAWFDENDLIDEAVSHALMSGDPDLAAQFMEAALCDVLNRDDRPALERWLRILPDEVIERRPGMLMVKAWAFQFSWRPQAQARVLEQVEALITDHAGTASDLGEASILRGQMLTLAGQAAFLRNQNAHAAALCQDALALLPPAWQYARGGAAIYLGLAMQASGQGPAVEQQLLDYYESLTHKATAYGLRLLLALGFTYVQEGRLDQVRQIAQAILPQAIQSGLVIPRFWAHYFLGIVHYHRNQLDLAQQHFDAVVQARFITQILTARASATGLVLIQQARGLDAEAWRTVERLSEFDRETRGAEDPSTRSLRARLMLLQGDLEGAAAWADTLTTPPPDQPLLWLDEPHLTKVRILLARRNDGDGPAALQLLDALHEIAQRTHNRCHEIELLALRALALELNGESGDALAALLKAVQLAWVGGFVRLFVEMGPPMQSMLERLGRRGLAVEMIRRILAAFPKPDTTSVLITEGKAQHGRHAVYEHLTGRELDVLMLLRERLSNKEIAQKLNLSTTTVKRHTANIYGKLGVNRRWEAVIKAEAHGLLPPR